MYYNDVLMSALSDCRLHKQIMDIGGTKMKAAQACVDAVNNKIDSVTGQITKAQVGIKTAERSGDTPEAY